MDGPGSHAGTPSTRFADSRSRRAASGVSRTRWCCPHSTRCALASMIADAVDALGQSERVGAAPALGAVASRGVGRREVLRDVGPDLPGSGSIYRPDGAAVSRIWHSGSPASTQVQRARARASPGRSSRISIARSVIIAGRPSPDLSLRWRGLEDPAQSADSLPAMVGGRRRRAGDSRHHLHRLSRQPRQPRRAGACGAREGGPGGLFVGTPSTSRTGERPDAAETAAGGRRTSWSRSAWRSKATGPWSPCSRGISSPPAARLSTRRINETLPKRLTSALNKVPGRVLVVGHTDDQPIRSLRYQDNFELSRERAVERGEGPAANGESTTARDWSGTALALRNRGIAPSLIRRTAPATGAWRSYMCVEPDASGNPRSNIAARLPTFTIEDGCVLIPQDVARS